MGLAFSIWMVNTGSHHTRTKGSSPPMAMLITLTGHQHLTATRPQLPLSPRLYYDSLTRLYPPTCTPIVMGSLEGLLRGTSSFNNIAPLNSTHPLPNLLEGSSFEATGGASWMYWTLLTVTSCRSDLRYFITWILCRNTRGNTYSRSSRRNLVPTIPLLHVIPLHRFLTSWDQCLPGRALY